MQKPKPFTLNALKGGCKHWQTELTKRKWPCDFHSAFYGDLRAIHERGMFTPAWWAEIIFHLRKWNALRTSTGGLTNAEVQKRAIRASKKLRAELARLHGIKDIADSDATWNKCQPFFTVAFGIKQTTTNSPVFASKLCHFVAPRIFPVIDNEIMGGTPDYGEYWQYIRGRWLATPKAARREMDDYLRKQIKNAGGTAIKEYPFPCKIAELCLIGERHK